MKYVTVEEIKRIEEEANHSGFLFSQMMEKAGQGVAQTVMKIFTDEAMRSVIGLVGSGNNGGDTIIALEQLAAHGWKAVAYLVKSRPEDDPLLNRLVEQGGLVIRSVQDSRYEELDKLIEQSDVLLDGVLGTGIRLPLKEDIARVLQHLQQAAEELFIVAVDCPSGMDCDTGETADETLSADLTVCLGAVKKGLLKLPAFSKLGLLETVDLGFDGHSVTWEQISSEMMEDELFYSLLPERKPDGHKGTFGKVFMVVGSANYPGTAVLCATAAYRSGAGLVQVGVPASIQPALVSAIPEATWLLLSEEMGVISSDAAELVQENSEKTDAFLIGPGLGRENTTRKFLEILLAGRPPLRSALGFVHPAAQKETVLKETGRGWVIDADGLYLLSQIEGWPSLLHKGTILTPHPGEMAQLTGLDLEDIQNHREQTALEYARKWNAIVVLKGAFTLIADPGGRLTIIPVACSALAKAGSGDVLSGMIVSLLAQGMAAYDAACAGAYLHGMAGLAAMNQITSQRSLLAGDISNAVAQVFVD